MSHGPRIDLYKSSDGWRWRMWVSSSKVGSSSESYVKRSAAIRNLETVTGGQFRKISTPDFPPYGILHREGPDGLTQGSPVRLVSE